MMNLQTVENVMQNPRVTMGWGKPQFKPNPRDSAIPGAEESKTTPNDPNNIGADGKTEPFKLLDLFSGIGGFSLGLERTGGFKTVAFCEIEEFPRRVLAKHWPEVPCYHDIRELTADRLAADGIAVDAICGGFPCQDISLAGAGAGLAGERSGLWFEYARLIGEIRPRYIIVENVAALLGRGLDAVLGSLASLGYDAEWHCIPASAVGAQHRRDRLWIVAYSQCTTERRRRISRPGEDSGEVGAGATAQSIGGRKALADAKGERRGKTGGLRCDEPAQRSTRSRSIMADAHTLDAQGLECGSHGPIVGREQIERQTRLCRGAGGHIDWTVEPAVGRVAHGVPDRVGQLRAYGNAVVPAIPELIGRAILASDRMAA